MRIVCTLAFLVFGGEPLSDKMPQEAREAIAAYEKALEREKTNLIETLDKMMPATQGELAAVKNYVKTLRGDKDEIVASVAKRPKNAKLTKRKMGKSTNVLTDESLKIYGRDKFVKIDGGVMTHVVDGQVNFGVDVKNAIIEFDYRPTTFAKAMLLIRHCYGGFTPDSPAFGCYGIQIGNGTGMICGGSGVGLKNQLPKTVPQTKVFEQPDQWNKAEIVLDGREITVFVNGRFVNKVEGIVESGGGIVYDARVGIELRNMKITMLE